MTHLVLPLTLIAKNNIPTGQALPIGWQRIPLLRLNTHLALSFGGVGCLLLELVDRFVELLDLLIVDSVELLLGLRHLVLDLLRRLYHVHLLQVGLRQYYYFEALGALHCFRLSETIDQALFNSSDFH